MKSMFVGIYPYSAETEPFLRHTCLLNPNYKICALFAPSSWYSVGKKITSLDNDIVWMVMDLAELKRDGHCIDTLFIPNFNVTEEIEQFLVDEIEATIPYLKRIICAAQLTKQNVERLQTVCSKIESECIFENYNVLKKPRDYGIAPPTKQNPSLLTIDTPIVVIAGLWEETDKFEISLALRKKFLKNDFRVTQVGARNCCELFDFHSFPSFMFNPSIDAVDKVFYFNRWIRSLAATENPDVIILTIPGAIQDLNEQFTKGHGVLPYITLQAILVDFLIMCTPYGIDSVDALCELSTMCEYRFGANVDCFHMSNLSFDMFTSEERDKVMINHVYRESVSKHIEEFLKNSSLPIINAWDVQSIDMLFDLIVDKLSGEDFQIL